MLARARRLNAVNLLVQSICSSSISSLLSYPSPLSPPQHCRNTRTTTSIPSSPRRSWCPARPSSSAVTSPISIQIIFPTPPSSRKTRRTTTTRPMPPPASASEAVPSPRLPRPASAPGPAPAASPVICPRAAGSRCHCGASTSGPTWVLCGWACPVTLDATPGRGCRPTPPWPI